jgi:MFS family permease
MEPSTLSPGQPTKKPGLLINRNFALLWLGQTISVFGDELFDFTLLIWIAAVLTRRPDGTTEPWAPLAVSGVLIATIIPYFLLGPLAGVFVDRWEKRQTMLWMDGLRRVDRGIAGAFGRCAAALLCRGQTAASGGVRHGVRRRFPCQRLLAVL